MPKKKTLSDVAQELKEAQEAPMTPEQIHNYKQELEARLLELDVESRESQMIQEVERAQFDVIDRNRFAVLDAIKTINHLRDGVTGLNKSDGFLTPFQAAVEAKLLELIALVQFDGPQINDPTGD